MEQRLDHELNDSDGIVAQDVQRSDGHRSHPYHPDHCAPNGPRENRDQNERLSLQGLRLFDPSASLASGLQRPLSESYNLGAFAHQECDMLTYPHYIRFHHHDRAEKLGYQLEARFRQARIVNGRHYDGLDYGILREEWARRYPRGFAAHVRA